jgi:hypothetical protein
MTDRHQPDLCWWCGRPLHDIDGIAVIHYRQNGELHVARFTCSSYCARQAVSWTEDTRHRDPVTE